MTPWQIGQKAEFSKTISESDIYLFAGICGDLNPAHVNHEYARTTRFEGRIAHGMMVASLIGTILGMILPGPGTILVSHSLQFLRPVKIGDTATARVEIIEVVPGRSGPKLRLRTWVDLQDGSTSIDGEAVVLPPIRA